MSRAVLGAVGVLLFATFARAEVVVELVPDDPGPYSGGETLTVDVWFHSEVPSDSYLWTVRLDFSDSNGQLGLDPTFTFDLSSSIFPEDFGVYPELPIPWTSNMLEYGCDPCRLQLPASGSLHVGSIGVNLPNEVGTYRLDVLNADDPDEAHGARIRIYPDGYRIEWRAFTGEITGGAYQFVVDLPAIPTLSGWGTSVMAGVLVGAMVLTIRRRVLALNERFA